MSVPKAELLMILCPIYIYCCNVFFFFFKKKHNPQVRYLEQQNKVLGTKWRLLQECATPPRKSIEPYYENFICNMKRQLESLSANREKLANEHAAIQHVVEEIKCK